MGDSCAQGGKPGIKETGTPEDVPRTAAITHAAGIKKAPDDVSGALLRLELHGFPHPVAELAATVGGYRGDPFPATSKLRAARMQNQISLGRRFRAVFTERANFNRSAEFKVLCCTES